MNKNLNELEFAIITPSYKPDFERCRLLVESIERCVPDHVKQYIIVSQRDAKLFRQLSSSRVEIIIIEALLSDWIVQLPMFERKWLTYYKPFMTNGWLIQQLVKLYAALAIRADVLLFCDSDMAFIRPFEMSILFKDGKLALIRTPHQTQNVQRWIRSSMHMLGLQVQKNSYINYVGNFVSWRRDNALKMMAYIEQLNHKKLIKVILNNSLSGISEYTIYGVFVEHILGISQAGHFPFEGELIKSLWHKPANTVAEINALFDSVEDHHIGVLVQSTTGVPLDVYRHKVEGLWEKYAAIPT